ncbi:MAG TPA: imidazolonepropionase, partial [Blastocatellia bacterium]|nr:imidazolonepropionase [Blastocatellia bacterium]
MNRSLAIIGASQLVTLAGPRRPRVGQEMRELAVIRNGAMLLRNGRIVQIGARSEIEKLIEADCEVVDAVGR